MRTTLPMVRIRVLGLLALASLVLAGGSALAAGGRVLNKSDVVTVKVVGQPDLDTSTRVDVDGTIQFPYVGRIKAAGFTEDGLARSIERRLADRQIVNDPHVLIEVVGFGAQVTVQGPGVGSSGLYTIDRTTTLAQILARAGGMRETGATVILQRRGPNGKIIRRYDGRDIVSGKVNGDNIFVQNDDEIYVDQVPFYYVYGYVGHAGEFALTRPLTVHQALAIAGGIASLGSEGRMRIKRRSADGQTEEVSASLDDQMQGGDMLIVDERLF